MSADRLRAAGRWLLGGALVSAGTAHLTFARDEFRAQVPDWLPVDADLVVLASGVVEIALGVALLAWRARRIEVGLATAAFFVAIFVGGAVTGVLAMVLIALSRVQASGNETVEARYESRAMNHEWG